MGILSYTYNAAKAALRGTSKVSPTITKVKPNVGRPSKSALNKQIQKTKASGAKLKQTLFESKNKAFKGNDFTFATSTKKTPSNTELKDQADYLNKTGKYKVKKAKGGRVGLKRGTGLRRPSNVEKIKKAFGPKQKPQSRMTRKKKSNVEKIKKTFGTLSVRAGIDNNPNPTYADKIAGAKMKNKKKKKFV